MTPAPGSEQAGLLEDARSQGKLRVNNFVRLRRQFVNGQPLLISPGPPVNMPPVTFSGPSYGVWEVQGMLPSTLVSGAALFMLCH